MKSWKTSIFGALVFASTVGGVLGLPPRVVAVSSGICVALGLNEAKDKNVTGGTVKQ